MNTLNIKILPSFSSILPNFPLVTLSSLLFLPKVSKYVSGVYTRLNPFSSDGALGISEDTGQC